MDHVSLQGLPDNILPYCTAGDNPDLASRYRIIISTCVSAGVLYSLGIKAGHFTHVFVDEVIFNMICFFAANLIRFKT